MATKQKTIEEITHPLDKKAKSGKGSRAHFKRMTYIAKELPATGYARLPAVCHAFGVSRNTYLRYADEGIYPKGFLLTKNMRVYPVEEIRECLIRLKAERRG